MQMDEDLVGARGFNLRPPVPASSSASTDGFRRSTHERPTPCGKNRDLNLLESRSVIRPKAAAALFWSESINKHQRHDDASLEAGEGPLVSEVITQSVFDHHRRGADQNAELIDKAGEEAAYGVRRQFIQMRGDDAERSLHAGLHENRRDY